MTSRHTLTFGATKVIVSPTHHPTGGSAVVVQVEDRWYLVLSTASCRLLIAALLDAVDEVDPADLEDLLDGFTDD